MCVCFTYLCMLLSVTKSCLTLSTPWTAALQASLSLSPGICSNSCPLSQWCHPTISSSATHFSFCLQFFPASGSFPMSQLFASGGQSIGTSLSASVLPMNIKSWFPSGLTGLISLLSKGLSRVFSSTTIPKHHSLVLSPLYSPALTPYIAIGKSSFYYTEFCQKSDVSAF